MSQNPSRTPSRMFSNLSHFLKVILLMEEILQHLGYTNPRQFLEHCCRYTISLVLKFKPQTLQWARYVCIYLHESTTKLLSVVDKQTIHDHTLSVWVCKLGWLLLNPLQISMSLRFEGFLRFRSLR